MVQMRATPQFRDRLYELPVVVSGVGRGGPVLLTWLLNDGLTERRKHQDSTNTKTDNLTLPLQLLHCTNLTLFLAVTSSGPGIRK